jgi:triosephosphate isomerase
MIVANWKCNGSREMIQDWSKHYKDTHIPIDKTYVGIAPPYLYVEHLTNSINAYGLDINTGVQDVDISSGARTSAISVDMIQDMECQFTILGHSERRNIFEESNETISDKLDSVGNKLAIILCVGESAEENNNKETKNVLEDQLSIIKGKIMPSSFSIAYEPVWAIGTGNTPTPDEINDIHKFIKDVVQSLSKNSTVPNVLYGGSVNDANAESFFKKDNVDGALIGGASLQGESFANIVNIFNGKTI